MNIRVIDNDLRLVPYYRNDETSLKWYLDKDVCKQVDNTDSVYDVEKLHNMYDYLCAHGECYYVEYRGELIGDVSLRDNCEIAVVICKKYQNMHIGRKCIAEMLSLGREKGYDKVTATIYSFNEQSKKAFLSVGFKKIGEETYEYEL